MSEKFNLGQGIELEQLPKEMWQLELFVKDFANYLTERLETPNILTIFGNQHFGNTPLVPVFGERSLYGLGTLRTMSVEKDTALGRKGFVLVQGRRLDEIRLVDVSTVAPLGMVYFQEEIGIPVNGSPLCYAIQEVLKSGKSIYENLINQPHQ